MIYETDVNLELLQNPTVLATTNEIDVAKYAVCTTTAETDLVGKVTYYGHTNQTGDGRTVHVDNVSIKGCGITPLTALDNRWYGSGELPLTEAVTDYINLSLWNHLFPDSPKPYGVILLDGLTQRNHSGADQAGVDYKEFEERWLLDKKALLIREYPVRLAALKHNNKDGSWDFLRSKHPDITTTDCYRWAMCWFNKAAARSAELWVRRLSVSGSPYDNYDIYGNCFDLTSAVPKRDFRNTYFTNLQVGLWDDLLSASVMLLGHILDVAQGVLWRSQSPSRDRFERMLSDCPGIINYWRQQKVCKLLGLTDNDIAKLSSEKPVEFDIFTNALVNWLKPPIYTTGMSDFHNTYSVPEIDVNAVGNDFRKLALELPSGRSNETELSELWSVLVEGVTLTEGFKERAIAITTDVVPMARMSPEIDGFVWEETNADITAFIDLTIEHLVTTVGVKE